MRPDPQPQAAARLRELAAVFLKVGTTAFGGPAAHVAMMEDEVVRRRRWLTREDFLDHLGATNLIPGPNSTELAIHIGHVRAGWPGLLVAGLAFILPATLIVSLLAWLYVRYGALPRVAGLLYGVKPVMIAVVTQALWRLARTAVKTRALGLLGVLALLAAMAGVHELLILIGAGAIMALARAHGSRKPQVAGLMLLAGMMGSSGGAVSAVTGAFAVAPFGLLHLFLIFAKIGSVLFGSGYVLLAFLRADLVTRLGWLSEAQLLDAIAVGQITPGPVFTTATFIGFLLGGWAGAAAATAGIFLPAFVFVALSAAIVPRLRRSSVASAVLDGVNVASLALMAGVAWQLGQTALIDVTTVSLAVGCLIALTVFRTNAAWLAGAGAAAGWFLH